MKKYWLIFKLTLEEYFVYRLNFFLWRFRSVVSFLALIFFWQAVYQGKNEVFGYKALQLITYIILVSFLKGIIFSSRTADLAGMIRSGEVVKLMLTPITTFRYFFSRDIADKFLNSLFVVVETVILLRIMNLTFYFPGNFSTVIIFLVSILMSIFIYFYLSLLISMIGFWVDNVWAPRWLVGVIFLEFFSGAFFPLDVLPKGLSALNNLTPFPYIIYFPTKIYLGQLSPFETVKILTVMLSWILVLKFFAVYVWRKGVKTYSAHGG